jgi:hypothetical protein
LKNEKKEEGMSRQRHSQDVKSLETTWRESRGCVEISRLGLIQSIKKSDVKKQHLQEDQESEKARFLIDTRIQASIDIKSEGFRVQAQAVKLENHIGGC